MKSINTSNNSNNKIINKLINYILITYNISIDILINNYRDYIKKILKKVRENNLEVRTIRKKRKEIREDIMDLEASMVTAQAFNDVVPGRGNGLIPNTTEIKILKRLSLKEELGRLLIQTELLEKSLEDNNKLIQDFLNLLPSQNQRTIMIMTYIDCMTNTEIASTLFYSIEAVDTNRWRALKELEKILNDSIINKKNKSV